jgi:HAD superfamily hydrolase (TIGR01509 family)
VTNAASKTYAVLFDMDGVLVRTDQLKAEAHSTTIGELGGRVPASFYECHMGNPHNVVRAAFLAEAGLTCAPERYTEIYQQIYKRLLNQNSLTVPGVRELLTELVELDFALAVVSSSRSWMLDRVLGKEKLAGFFNVRVSAEDIYHAKPSPDAYLLALERLTVDGLKGVAMEDSKPGIDAACAAGLPVIAIRHGYNRSHDFTKAVAEFGSLRDTAAVIKAIYAALAIVRA